MNYTLFISDMHLQAETPNITTAFLRLLQNQAKQADALYILGDCFETWIGDDDRSTFNQQIIDALRALVNAGIPVYFIPGNRDFLLGSKFATDSGIILLNDPTLINLYNTPILLSHGDLLCTLDQRHQNYRKQTHRRWLQKLFLALPLSYRRFIAQKLRQKSRQHNQTAPSQITDVTPSEVQRLMQQHHTSLLIHGHTHRPAIHEETTGKRIVLGAWHDTAMGLIYYNNGQYKLIDLNCAPTI